MAQDRPTHAQILAAIGRAETACVQAANCRTRYSRRRSPRRPLALAAALEQCVAVAGPFRSWLGMVAWGGIDLDDELAMKKIMEKLRYERRHLERMLNAK